ncbi:galactokinase [Thalassotalea euphylliae]|uniref:Galactokinase n=1 Tax=Thalassotalea euphylliae TaxID=1655234 RepID=A0A3E0U4V7_9GAMM|nr:galactokinase [Thalassotalea euphylliae]REL31744.1 galactokinase [Thalassotalea euphylliae]
MSRSQFVTDLHVEQFKVQPALVIHAPGRVNLIGDHTDYNDGFVLPAAINYGTDIAASKRDDKVISVYAHDCNQESAEFSLEDIQFDEQRMWLNYVAGTLKVLMETFPDIQGADMVVSGNVPQGAGLSSSASFEIAILKTFVELYDLNLDGVKAALKGQRAENTFVGCNCGIMDQLISAMGKDKHAMLLDCRSLTFQDAPIPEELSIFIVNSNVRRGLVDSEYNQRREQCEKVAAHFGVNALRDLSIEQLENAKEQLDPILFKRAKHVVTENARVESALLALKNNDVTLLSGLMRDSHNSLRDDFQVTVKEMDGLVEMIDGVLGNQGGVRMTGGGFGGCIVALTPTKLLTELTELVEKEYPEKFGLKPSVYVCRASQGAFRK